MKLLLKPGEIYLIGLGTLSQNPIFGRNTPRSGGKKVMLPIPKRSRDGEVLQGVVEFGEFRTVIDRRYRLDRIVEGSGTLRQEEIGNVVISVRARHRSVGLSVRPPRALARRRGRRQVFPTRLRTLTLPSMTPPSPARMEPPSIPGRFNFA